MSAASKDTEKARRKAARKAEVAQLGQTAQALEGFSRKCVLYCKQLSSKTDAIIDSIQRHYRGSRDDADRLRFLRHFLAQWFINFLGCKDEAMVLLKGELTRSYHLQEHAQYVHDRGKENAWYKTEKLSSCSVDGWRYCRLRTLERGLGGSNSLQDQLDEHADRCDAVSDMLDPLIESMDRCGERLGSALQSLRPELASVTLQLSSKDNHHLGERLCVLLSEDAPELSLKWTRKAAQKVTRAAALSTVVEEPPNVASKAGTSLQNAAPNAPAATLNIAKSRRHNVIIEEDDVENQAQERQAAADQAARAERKRKAAEDDFSMLPISLDDIKRQLGAHTLLSTARPGDRHAKREDSEDDESQMDVVPAAQGRGQEQEQEQEQEQRASSQQTLFDTEMAALLAHKNCTVTTRHPGLPLPSVRKVNIILIVPGESFGQQMSMSVSRGAWAAEGEDGMGEEEYPLCIDATEVLDEVYRRVWSIFEAASCKQVPLPVLPRTIRLSLGNSTSYAHGSLVPVPANAKVPLLVFCEDNAAVRAMLSRFATRVTSAQAVQHGKGLDAYDDGDLRDTEDQRQLRAAARRALPIVPHVVLLERLVATLKAARHMPARLDLSKLGDSLLQQELTANLLLQELHLLFEGDSSLSLEEKDEQHAQAQAAGVDIDLTLTCISGTLLFELLPFARKITLDSCSLDAYELRVCAACLAQEGARLREQNREVGSKTGSAKGTQSALPKLQELRLLHNDLFENFSNALYFAPLSNSYVDGATTTHGASGQPSPVDIFFVELFLAAPSLTAFDVSHCCSVEKKRQPLALAKALATAARQRTERGFPPLSTLSIRGLRKVAALNTSGRHVLDVDRDLLAHVKLAMPDCAVDVEGMSRRFY